MKNVVVLSERERVYYKLWVTMTNVCGLLWKLWLIAVQCSWPSVLIGIEPASE